MRALGLLVPILPANVPAGRHVLGSKMKATAEAGAAANRRIAVRIAMPIVGEELD